MSRPVSTAGQVAVDEDDVPDVDALIAEYDAEKPARQLHGALLAVVSTVAAVTSAYVLYRVFAPQDPLRYRMLFLAAVLPLTFLAYRSGLRAPTWLPWLSRGSTQSPPSTRPDNGAATTEPAGTAGDGAVETAAADDPRSDVAPQGPPRTVRRERPSVGDWILAVASAVACAYPLFGFDDFIGRTFAPHALDIAFGALLVLLVLEATRRTCGWILPAVCVAFLLYAYYSGYIPGTLGTKGYGVERIVEQMYMGTEGLFGVPLDVAATYIVLFTIYGAVLDLSGAGKFFIDISFAAFRRSRSAPGRTVTLAGFLLGTVSGSGTATAVSLGSVAWPILRRAGYPREQGGGVLAAAGIGAILSPPTLGAAAFIIAEFLNISYLRVLAFATVPTILYYLGIILAIEIDARRFGTRAVAVEAGSAWRLLLRFGYHFSSLAAIVVFMALDLSPFLAVVYATGLAFVLSFLDRRNMLTPRRAFRALAQGVTSVLPVAATCAAAGIIVGVTTLTGLGQNLASIIVDLAATLSWNHTSQLVVTVALAAVAVLVLGLAVPVTASFVIAAGIIAPALKKLGVSDPAAYMFIFYYAVLSEVSPPTALAAVASSSITGGEVYKTMWMTWKYTLPAFLVPFAFVLAPSGEALLGQAPLPEVLLATVVSALAVAALAAVTGRWILGPAGWGERVLCAAAALLLLYLEPVPVVLGLVCLGAAMAVHVSGRRRRAASDSSPAPTERTA